jgi:AcrR family transcriptional regulator
VSEPCSLAKCRPGSDHGQDLPKIPAPSDAPRRSKKAEQAAATRRILLDVARELFTTRGFAGTGTEEIVAQAGMTMGALYYHFKDKRDLFRAVFEEVEQEFDEIGRAAAAAESDPWKAFLAGCIANVEATRRPDIRQVCMLDAPSVLGWETWRQIDGQFSMRSMGGGIKALIKHGIIPPEPVEPLAALLVGALNEAGMMLAHHNDDEAMRRQILDSLVRFLERLRPAESPTA